MLKVPGHHTARVEADSAEASGLKHALHRHGFYYCDTLLEPWCTPGQLVAFEREGVAIGDETSLAPLLGICHGAFRHGRFHRDFNIDPRRADMRYDNWLKELYRDGHVTGLAYHRDLAGFIARAGDCLVLHAMAERFRGQGLAKYFWSAFC